MRVLLVEDDETIGEGLTAALSAEGMSVDWVRDGAAAEAALSDAGLTVVLLDLGLPGADGLDLLKAARRKGVDTPVLIITARGSVEDRVAGLDLGADDYLLKPFEVRELAARMRALIRRRAGRATSMLVAGDAELDAGTHELRHGEVRAVLSAREFSLMHALMERPGRILSRQQIEERIYGWGEEVESNAVDVLISFRPAQVRQVDHPQHQGRRMDAPEILRTASLRRTALVYVTVLLSVVGFAASAFAYVYAHDAATEFLDGQLRQIALNAGTGVSPAAAPAPADQDPEDQFAVSIWEAGGRLVHASLPSIEIPRQTKAGYANVEAGGEKWRVYTASDSRRMVQVGQREVVRQEIAQAAALGAAAPVLFAIPLAWLVVGWAMNRVLTRLNALSVELAERSVRATTPIPLASVPREVAPLVLSMNSLIVRLQDIVKAQRQFVSDAAHELRTPLAGMQIQVENLSREGRDDQGATAALARGVRRASALVNQLLQLARLDEGESARDERIDVNALVLECVADHAAVADRRQVDLAVDFSSRAASRGAPEEARAVFSSLIDNAVRYTPAGGRIDVTIARRGDDFIVEVSNTGDFLPKGAEMRVFDRFFRASPQRTEGTGLGLAIARRASERQGFGLVVENRTDGVSGVAARVYIPVSRAAACNSDMRT